MQKKLKSRLARSVASVALLALLAAPAATQQSAAPIARYTIDAGTLSGMAAMGKNGGMGGAMSMMFGGGGGNRAIHEMVLRLGSTQSPTGGAAKADHFLPAAAGLGASVPLVTPTSSGASPEQPQDFQRPKGRLLIYWGCGAKAGPGQPVVIDFAKLAAGQIPPGLFASAAAVPADWKISPANSRTYGDWPNGKSAKTLTGNSSILGDHRIAGNYSPEIKFALTQDFLAPVTGRATDAAGGATQLSWNAVAGATGYYAWVFGAKGEKNGQPMEMVWWASSATQQFGGALWDWLSPGTVQKLITQKVVLPPSQTSCTVPAEVKQASGEMMMGNLYAYGPQADFAYPPRPKDPRIAWKPEWTARVRYRSNSMWMLGMPDMGAMMSQGDGEDSDDAPKAPPKKKCKGGFGGILAGAAGVGC